MIEFKELTVDTNELKQILDKSVVDAVNNILDDDIENYKDFFGEYKPEEIKVELWSVDYCKNFYVEDVIYFDCVTEPVLHLNAAFYAIGNDDQKDYLADYRLLFDENREAVDTFLGVIDKDPHWTYLLRALPKNNKVKFNKMSIDEDKILSFSKKKFNEVVTDLKANDPSKYNEHFDGVIVEDLKMAYYQLSRIVDFVHRKNKLLTKYYIYVAFFIVALDEDGDAYRACSFILYLDEDLNLTDYSLQE